MSQGIISRLWMIFSRRAIMNGTEIACYWIGLSFGMVLFFLLLFKLGGGNELIGITIGLLISLVSCLFLNLKRRKKAMGLEIALYWIGFSCAITGFLSTIMHLAGFYQGAGIGALIGVIISFISGFFIIIKRRKTLSGKETFIYWLGLLSCFSGAAYLAFLPSPSVPRHDYGGPVEEFFGEFFGEYFREVAPFLALVVSLSYGLLISLLIGIFILIKKRKGAGWLEILLYWLGCSIAFTTLLSLLFEGPGTFVGLLISIMSGIFIIIYRVVKAKKAQRHPNE